MANSKPAEQWTEESSSVAVKSPSGSASTTNDNAAQPNDKAAHIKRFTLRDLERSTLIFLRRMYHVYFILLSMVFLFVVGLNFMLQVLFSLFLPRVSDNRNFFFVAFGLLSLILLLGYFVASIVASSYMLLMDAWSVDEFVFYRRVLTFDNGIDRRETVPGSLRAIIDRTLQVFIILSLDVLPFVMGAVYGVADQSTGALSAFFLTAMIVAAFHSCNLWLFGLIKDYFDKIVDVVKIFRNPEVVKELESFVRSAVLLRFYGTQDIEAQAATPENNENSSSTADPESPVANVKQEPAAGLNARSSVLALKAVRKIKRDPDHSDRLNVCVNLFEFLDRAFANLGVKLVVIAGLIVGMILGILLQQTIVFLVCIAIFFVGICAWLVSFIVAKTPRNVENKQSAFFGAMSIFFHKHCGVQRFLMIRFSVLVLILAIMLSLVMVFGSMWTSLVITGMLGVFVLVLGIVAYKAPQYLWVVVITECTFFLITSLINNFVVFGGLVGAMTLFLLVANQVFLTRKFRTSFTFLAIVLFVFLGFGLVMFSIGYYASKSSPSSYTAGDMYYSSTGYKPYQFCSQRWGNMSLIDFAMFSKVSYNTEDYLAGDFNAWFPPSTGWAKTDYYAKASSVTFYRFDNSITNQTVVAVRGTASGSDVLSDVDIWMPIALFQGASILGPSFLQTSLIDILYWANFVERILRSDTGRFYYDDLDDYMKQVLKTKTADQVYLTGHSLGGGLSKIVGARRGVTAITFSSPGLYYTSRSVDVELDALRRVAVTLKPMKDAVPRVDDQAETVFQTDCDESVPTCHFITLTLCQLMHACGDPKGRGLKRDICPTALRV